MTSCRYDPWPSSHATAAVRLPTSSLTRAQTLFGHAPASETLFPLASEARCGAVTVQESLMAETFGLAGGQRDAELKATPKPNYGKALMEVIPKEIDETSFAIFDEPSPASR